MTVPAESVAAASRAWVWVPPNATTVETPEYLLARFPEWFGMSSCCGSTPERPAGEVVDELLARAGELGVPRSAAGSSCTTTRPSTPCCRIAGESSTRPSTSWPSTSPPVRPTSGRRRSRGALGDRPGHDARQPAGRRGRVRRLDASRGRDRRRGRAGPEGRGDRQRLGRGLPRRRTRRQGGLALVDGVARLWGGAVLEEARRRGAYRAVLDARLRRGIERGATMALVKGRVQTSGRYCAEPASSGTARSGRISSRWADPRWPRAPP